MKSKKEKPKRKFFNFQKNKFSKKTADYHSEIKNLTEGLINIERRINRNLILCKGHIESLSLKSEYLPSKSEIQKDFSDLLYHVENFCFRAGMYKDKLAHFINQSLQLGFSEKEMGLVQKIEKNGIAKKSSIDTELKKLGKNECFKWAFERRKIMAHRIYYKNNDYHPLMMPSLTEEDPKKFLKKWKGAIVSEAELSKKFVHQVIKLNDSVMEKINKYKENS